MLRDGWLQGMQLWATPRQFVPEACRLQPALLQHLSRSSETPAAVRRAQAWLIEQPSEAKPNMATRAAGRSPEQFPAGPQPHGAAPSHSTGRSFPTAPCTPIAPGTRQHHCPRAAPPASPTAAVRRSKDPFTAERASRTFPRRGVGVRSGGVRTAGMGETRQASALTREAGAPQALRRPHGARGARAAPGPPRPLPARQQETARGRL